MEVLILLLFAFELATMLISDFSERLKQEKEEKKK
jgi:hypothetical protein